jgi:hypothetical protein
MESSDLESFVEELQNIADGSSLNVSPIARTVALFRVAIEYGAVQMGLPMLSYMMSRLLTITLGVATGEEKTTSYESILEEFDETGELKH